MKYALLILALFALSACDKSATEHNLAVSQNPTPTPAPTASDNPHDLKALAEELGQSDEEMPEVQPIITADGKTQIDWSHIHTKQPKADLATYTYPIALDAQAVQNYAKQYHISPKEAQHSIVVGMASPEALGKVLDQLKDGKYLGHRLTDGANMTLVITTTPDVVADKAEYVFADKFGQGLVLPVVIEPKADKGGS